MDCWLTGLVSTGPARSMAATWLVRPEDMMTLGGLSASLPSRLTESTVWSEDRIWLGLDS